MSAQSTYDSNYVRMAQLEIFPEHLSAYLIQLKKGVETAVAIEPGVLSIRAVQEKDHPEKITLTEIYASKAAYQRHILTPHFLAYKTAVAKMVKSLVLTDVQPVLFDEKALSKKE